MKRMLNNKGSALIWAMLATCVLSITVAGILTLCMSYYMRSLRESAQYRAALLSRSTMEYLSGEITAGNTEYIPQAADDTSTVNVTENIINMTMDYEGFVCTAKIERNTDSLRIYADAPYSDETVTLIGIMTLSGGVWTFDGYTEG